MKLISDDSRIFSLVLYRPHTTVIKIGENILKSGTKFMKLPPHVFDAHYVAKIRSEPSITVLVFRPTNVPITRDQRIDYDRNGADKTMKIKLIDIFVEPNVTVYKGLKAESNHKMVRFLALVLVTQILAFRPG